MKKEVLDNGAGGERKSGKNGKLFEWRALGLIHLHPPHPLSPSPRAWAEFQGRDKGGQARCVSPGVRHCL